MDEDKLKLAFSRIKEDISRLDTEINKNKERILEILELVKSLKHQNELILGKFNDLELNTLNSIGNQGVQTNNQSTNNQRTINEQSTMNPLNVFKECTNRELLVFLTIYQLEEEKKSKVSYDEIAKKISLSASGVRGFIHCLVYKGVPIIKERANNQLTFLSIDPKFKDLNLKNTLVNMYYQRDPNQRRLSDI